jgi:DNA repair photolyase
MENPAVNVTLERSKMNGKPVLWLEAKTVINFTSGFGEKLLCDGLTFSTGTSCAYTCEFCYVPSMMNRTPQIVNMLAAEGLSFEDVVIRRRNPIEVAKRQIFDSKGRTRFAGDNRVIYSSPLVDIAANMDLIRETAEMAELILANTCWTIRFLSKSNMLPKLAEMLKRYQDRVIYGVSTGTLDNKLAAAFEGGTPLVSKRIESLHWLQDNGYRTYGMVCPSLPMVGAEYADFSKAAAEALRVDRCEHVWAEVMNVRGESLARTVASLTAAGYAKEASLLEHVQTDKDAWEQYARDTFEAHAAVVPAQKLRFLQYVDKNNLDWWMARKDQGAVLLGKIAQELASDAAVEA